MFSQDAWLKNSRFFHGCKNIHLIYLISAVVTYKGYLSLSDGLSSELALGETEVILGKKVAINEVLYWIFIPI